jgi:hypothetical protein
MTHATPSRRRAPAAAAAPPAAATLPRPAAATGRRVLGRPAAERMPVIGGHMPFPAPGHAQTAGHAFRHVPHSHQVLLQG